MEIVLVNPNSRAIGRVATTNPPMGLLYIASYLRESGYDVSFIDADVDNLSYRDVEKRVSDADVIGVTMVTVQASFAYSLIQHLKQVFPRKIVVAGGAHPSGMRQRIFQECPEIDYSVIGEGEQTMLELCEAIERGENPASVDGVCYKKGNEVIMTNPRQRIDSLDSLPFPAVDLAMPINRYKPYYPPNKGKLAFTVMATRGCVFRCKFCGSNMVWGWTVKYRSPSNVVDEVEWLHSRFGVDEIYYLDDTLNLNPTWFRKLCEEKIRRGIHRQVCCKGNIRANKQLVSKDLFRLAKKAGFWLFAVGVESGNQQILNSLNKNLTLEEVERCFKILRSCGFKIAASFMIGNLGEDMETVMQTIRFAEKLKPDHYDFPIATPLPGTVYETEAEAKGLIKSRDWRKYAMGLAVCETEHLSLEQLETLRTYAFQKMTIKKSYWLRLKKMLTKIPLLTKAYRSFRTKETQTNELR